ENEMLEFAMDYEENASRLSCQIKISDELDGIVIRTPESQY
ncbi:MAG: 2Fe-2S ferredoxin, partial [Planctomycetota bacterium]